MPQGNTFSKEASYTKMPSLSTIKNLIDSGKVLFRGELLIKESKKVVYRITLSPVDSSEKQTPSVFYLRVTSTQNFNTATENTFNGDLSILKNDGITIAENWTGTKQSFAHSSSVETDFAANPNNCNLSVIHGCVASTINNMGWVSYGLCCATAYACYGVYGLIAFLMFVGEFKLNLLTFKIEFYAVKRVIFNIFCHFLYSIYYSFFNRS
ncbi:MAG: hypothetical protein ACR2FN_01785 [Chitinophagaceae bacterium]